MVAGASPAGPASCADQQGALQSGQQDEEHAAVLRKVAGPTYQGHPQVSGALRACKVIVDERF
eukprot:5036126-Pyramimonas_sp.AAC.1